MHHYPCYVPIIKPSKHGLQKLEKVISSEVEGYGVNGLVHT